jgi:hypothetical protein
VLLVVIEVIFTVNISDIFYLEKVFGLKFIIIFEEVGITFIDHAEEFWMNTILLYYLL